MGSPSAPSTPNPAKTYEQGIQTYLKYLPQLTSAEYDTRQQYDPLNIQHQQDLQQQYGPVQADQQLQQLNQLDPAWLSGHDQLGSTLGNELSSGSSLTPEETKQVEGYARAAQSARGNIMGNAPATAEAYALGDRGRQILQQRVSNMEGYLAGPSVPQQLTSIAPISADRSFSYADPASGYQGQNFGLQNYQNMLGASQLSGGNPWGSALSGAASGAAAGSAAGPYGTAIGAVAGGLGGYFSSDMRLKKHVQWVGRSPQGINIFEFNYTNSPTRFRGVMAQDIEERFPHAVRTDPRTGYKSVNYDLIDVNMEKVNAQPTLV